MAVFKPMIIQKNETDIGKVVRQLYRFSEDLKYTISNLSLEDNISNDVLNSITDRNNKVRKIQFSTDALNIEYDDYASSVQTKLSQSSESIQLLVATGNVVHEMLTRMEMYGEYIRLTSGHLIIDAQNMKLDKPGNAYFSGNITGGSININNRFAVSPSGDVYIDDALTTTTLNPAKAIVAANMEIYNDDDYINVKDSDQRSMGLIAQELDALQKKLGTNLPLVDHSEEYLSIPYGNNSVLFAGAIKAQQKEIKELEKALKELKEAA